MWQKTNFVPESLKNFFESGVFTMGWSGYLKHEFFFSWPNVAVMVEYLWETAANISSMCNSLREKFLQLFVRRSFGYSPDISGFFSGHSTLNVTNNKFFWKKSKPEFPLDILSDNPGALSDETDGFCMVWWILEWRENYMCIYKAILHHLGSLIIDNYFKDTCFTLLWSSIFERFAPQILCDKLLIEILTEL